VKKADQVPYDQATRDPINHFVSLLRKEVKQLDAAGIPPERYLEDDRANIIAACRQLVRIAGIDAETIHRLENPIPLTTDDPLFATLFGKPSTSTSKRTKKGR